MNKKPATNIPASVRGRLLNISRTEKREFQETLTRFALERLLYRLGATEYADQFVLKGALLFVLWTEEIHRTTQDMDLLGSGDPSLERLVHIFQTICRADVPDDGLVFDVDSVVGRFIREENIYNGVRIKLLATLERAYSSASGYRIRGCRRSGTRRCDLPGSLGFSRSTPSGVSTRNKHSGEVSGPGDPWYGQ